ARRLAAVWRAVRGELLAAQLPDRQLRQGRRRVAGRGLLLHVQRPGPADGYAALGLALPAVRPGHLPVVVEPVRAVGCAVLAGVAAPGRRLAGPAGLQQFGVDLLDATDATQRHGHSQFVAQGFQQVLHASLTGAGQGPGPGATDQHALGAEGQGLEQVDATAYAAIQED